MLKIAIIAAAILLAMSVPAYADPITIGGFLFTNTFLGGVFGLNTLIVATQIGLGLAAAGASALLSGALSKRGQGVDPGQYRGTFDSSESSELNFIGRCRAGGLKVFGNTAGTDRYRMILHSATPLVAIEEYYLGARPVTVEANGDVSSPPYAKPGGSWVNWLTKSGEGTTTAWASLISAFSSLWTSDHKAQGIAQSLVKYISPGVTTEKFGKLYQGGEPSIEVLGRFGRVYDPREPACDPDDPTTWIWSMNGPLCAARIMLSYPNLTADDFDWDFISDEADKADALVATLTGTAPRSQCSGVWLSEDKRGETMTQVLRSIGADIVLSDSGLIRIRLIDDAPTEEIEFTADHVLSWDWKSGPDAAERPNVCRVKYYSPERNYELTEINLDDSEWARVDDEVARYGEKYLDIDLPFCPDASQAQRVARREFLIARSDQGSVTLNMAGMAAWGLSYATIELDGLGVSPLAAIAAPRCDDENGTVDIPFTVWPDELVSAPWNPATMESAAPDEIPSLEYQADLATPMAPAGAAIVQYADLSYEIRLKFAGVTGGTQAEAVYRDYTDDLPNPYAGMTEYLATTDAGFSGSWYAYVVDNTTGVRNDFKTRFFNDDDEGSHFSPTLTINPFNIVNTTPATPIIDVEVTTGASGVAPWEFDIAVYTTDLHVALLEVDVDAVSAGTFDISSIGRPEVAATGHYEMTDTFLDQVFTVTATAYTSNGTPSATATYTYTVPGTG